MAAHSNAIYMHAGLFRRVDALYERLASLGLNSEQVRLLERVHGHWSWYTGNGVHSGGPGTVFDLFGGEFFDRALWCGWHAV